jgi:uncharacterized protein (DUF305 family)
MTSSPEAQPPADLRADRLATRLTSLPRWAAWVPVFLALLVFTFVLGWVGHDRASRPGSGSADVGFLRDMTAHHDQAVAMALVVFGANKDPSPVVRQFAELGRMYTWLTEWGYDLGEDDRTPMQWMHDGSHDHMDGMTVATMPGMQTGDAIAKLRAANGSDLDRLFLVMMRAHHDGGIPMAEYAETHAGNKDLRTFAHQVSDGQKSEVNDYTATLTKLGLS